MPRRYSQFTQFSAHNQRFTDRYPVEFLGYFVRGTLDSAKGRPITEFRARKQTDGHLTLYRRFLRTG
jgi:hypothetical protein